MCGSLLSEEGAEEQAQATSTASETVAPILQASTFGQGKLMR